MRWRTAVLVAIFVAVDLVVIGAAYALSHRGGDADPTSASVPTASPSADATSGAAAGSSPSASASGSAGTPDWTGPLYLATSASGRLARVTRGSCDDRSPVRSRVWLAASLRAPLKQVQVPGLQESLGVVVGADDVTVVGTGPGCKVFGFVSDDDGASWRKGDVPDDVWYLDRDTTQSVIHGPVEDGAQNLDCVPVSVTTLAGGDEALASCADANVVDLMVRRGAAAATRSYLTDSPTGAAVGEDRDRLALARTDRCVAALVRTNPDTEPRQVACLGRDDAPLGLAASGKRVFAQVGYRLLISTDGGRTFTRYPGDAASS